MYSTCDLAGLSRTYRICKKQNGEIESNNAKNSAGVWLAEFSIVSFYNRRDFPYGLLSAIEQIKGDGIHKEIKMTRRATCLVIILMVGSIINLGVTARQYYAKRVCPNGVHHCKKGK